MTEEELKTLIDRKEHQALSYYGGSLSKERELAIEYYHGNIDVPAEEGTSKFVSTDVRDAIDGMLPDILDIFLSSDDVVKFEPVGPEDENGAKQATDTANYVFYKQNNGALILYEWFKTAMLEKNGIVKFWWEDSEKQTEETYEGLTDEQLAQLASDPNVEITAHTQTENGHDVTVKVKRNKGKICIKPIPSEEFLIDVDHTSISLLDCPFTAHRTRLTASQLLEMGIDVKALGITAGDENPTAFTPEAQARRRYTEERGLSGTDTTMYGYLEAYVLADFDGDGYDELRLVKRVNGTIVENEKFDHVPFAAICPDIMPFRFHGLSIADLILDVQKTKSVIIRQMLNSLYLANNPRIAVQENAVVDLDDLLISRAGGIIRTRIPPGQAMMPVETRFVGQQAFPMLEYQDTVKEARTGFTRYSQGMDADSLNKTATGVSLITTASAKRQKLIARMFAETGLKDLFKGIIFLLNKYNNKPMAIRLRNEWVNVDPRSWNTGWDMTVNVGLGTGDKTQQLAMLQNVVGMQNMLLQTGKAYMVQDVNLYNSARRMAELSGFKQQSEFFTPPSDTNQPPQMPPPPEVVKIQMENDEAKMKVASAERIKGAEMQHGEQIAKIQSATNIEVAKINAQKDKEIAAAKIKADAEIELFKANLQKEMDLESKQFEAAMREKENEREHEKEEKMEEKKDPTIHIHMPKGKRIAKKNPDGSWFAEDI